MTLNDQEIKAIVDSLDPPDWVQIRLTAKLSPAERVLAGMRAQELARSILRGAFHERFPKLSQSELNMTVLAYLTPIRVGPETPKAWQERFARTKRDAGSFE